MAAARGVVRGHPAGGLGRAFALFALDWFLSGDVGRGALYSGVALLQVASAAFVLRHQRVRVGPDGLDVPVRWRLVILSWSEIVDVRGEGGAGSEYVVVERREGPPVRLPRGLRQRTVTVAGEVLRLRGSARERRRRRVTVAALETHRVSHR